MQLVFITSDPAEEIYTLFKTEIDNGIGDTGIKPGAIKVASGNGSISSYECSVFHAAALVGNETGVPIFTHTHAGTMGVEQAELFTKDGVNPQKVVIGHMCGDLNLEHHLKILDMGFRIGFDRWGHSGTETMDMTDDMRLGILTELVKRGYASQILFSQDGIVTYLGRNSSTLEERIDAAYKKMTHVAEKIVPALLSRGVTTAEIDMMTGGNAANLYK